MATQIKGLIGGTRATNFFKIDPELIIIQEGFNPRDSSNIDPLELYESIKENGVVSPLIIKLDKDGNVLLVDGERRLTTVLKLIEDGVDIQSVPCLKINKSQDNEVDLLMMAMIANDSKQLTPLEFSETFARLLKYGLKPAEIAKKVGKSRGWVDNMIILNNLNPSLKQELRNGVITLNIALDIVRENQGDYEAQNEDFKIITENAEIITETVINEDNEPVEKVVKTKLYSKGSMKPVKLGVAKEILKAVAFNDEELEDLANLKQLIDKYTTDDKSISNVEMKAFALGMMAAKGKYMV